MVDLGSVFNGVFVLTGTTLDPMAAVLSLPLLGVDALVVVLTLGVVGVVATFSMTGFFAKFGFGVFAVVVVVLGTVLFVVLTGVESEDFGVGVVVAVAVAVGAALLIVIGVTGGFLTVTVF